MKIEIPKNCPCCGYTLELVNDQLFCRNGACGAQLNKKLEHFTKTLGIKGFGPRTIEKLNLADITELFYLDRDTAIEALGSEKVADKLLDEIERAKSASFATVLASFSIPLIGNTAATKLANFVNNFDEITAEKCKEAGLGEKATNNILTWLEKDYIELKEFLPFSFNSKKITNSAGGPTVCITGKLSLFKNKAEATTILTELGFRCVDSVTKTLNYLIDESDKGSSKRKKAEEYGVTIINNLNNFLEQIKNDRKAKEMVG
jgi:NAD-dependent DNA ligase